MKKLNVVYLLLAFIVFFQNVQAETHWLEFNPFAFSTEFFRENNILRGSCGAASVVIVESNLNLASRIPTDAVKNKNNQMRADPNVSMRPYLDGMYYISSIDGIGTRLQKDNYGVSWLGNSNRQVVAKNIYAALARKHWVIILARHGFNSRELRHFYPIYGGDMKLTNSSVNELTSSLNAIDDFYGYNETFNPSSPNWDFAYKRGVNLKQVLDAMISGSTTGTYNAIEVYKH